jgi:hypothetical protein
MCAEKDLWWSAQRRRSIIEPIRDWRVRLQLSCLWQAELQVPISACERIWNPYLLSPPNLALAIYKRMLNPNLSGVQEFAGLSILMMIKTLVRTAKGYTGGSSLANIPVSERRYIGRSSFRLWVSIVSHVYSHRRSFARFDCLHWL